MALISRVRRACRRRACGEAGFGLVESVVAAFLLVLLGGSVLGVVTLQLHQSGSDRDRVTASSLAAREIEILRQEFNTGDTGASAVINQSGPVDNAHPYGAAAPSDTVLNGQKFDVSSDVTWLPFGAGKSACDGGAIVSYPSVRLTVTVTWPNMGGVAPVTSQTILTPSKDLVNSTAAGYLAVKVTNASGGVDTNLLVTAAGPAGTFTQLTDSSGCAVFRLTSAGTYNTSLSQAGYVDYYGNPTPSSSAAVTIGNLQRIAMTYDRALTLQASFAGPAGYSLPTNLPTFTLFNSGLQTNANHTEFVASSGATTTIPNLWPFPDGYTLWGTSCTYADPAGSPTNGTRAAPVTGSPGTTQNAVVTLAPVQVTVIHDDGTPAGGEAVSATVATDGSPAWNSGCAAADSPLGLGTTPGAGPNEGVLNVAVPYGEWVFSTPDGSASGDIKVDQSGVIQVQVQVP